MSYADGLMSTGERIGYRDEAASGDLHLGRPLRDPGARSSASSCSWLGSGMDPDGVERDVKTLLELGARRSCSSAGSRWRSGPALRYINQEYVLTNRRVIQVEGVLNRKSTDSSLEKINDADAQAVVLRADARLRRPDRPDRVGERHRRDEDAAQPDRVQEADARRQARLRGRHGARRLGAEPADPRWRPGRGDRPPAAPRRHAHRPRRRVRQPAPRRRARAEANPDEVTRTLASLADLRDRGAITPEEYEAQEGGPARRGSDRGRRPADAGRRAGYDTRDPRSKVPIGPRPRRTVIRPSIVVGDHAARRRCRSTSSATRSRPIGSATARPSCSGG